uniref:Uncharacterized protein n=1 Tax=Auxenochlorella protothecoides TaxID=3075 RepID=A0A1D1ZPK5_AUXPR
MRVDPPPPGLFHLAHTADGLEISTDPRGFPAPLRSLQAGAEAMRRARELWGMWRRPAAARGEEDWVDIPLPRLIRRTTLERRLVPARPEALPGEAAAAAAHAKALAKVRSAAQRAAKLAAAAGLDFEPPPGLGQGEMPGAFPKLDVCAVEAAAAAAAAAQATRAAAAAVVGGASPSSPALGRYASEDCAPSLSGVQSSGPGSPRFNGGLASQEHTPLASAGLNQTQFSSADTTLTANYPAYLQASPRERSETGGRAAPQYGDSLAAAPAGDAGPVPVGVDASLFPPGYKFRGPSRRTPPKSWRLKLKDITPALTGRTVQLHWPDDNLWWPAVVRAVDVPRRSVVLFYETGDEESIDLAKLVAAGEVAWVEPPSAPGTQAGAQKRARQGSDEEAEPGAVRPSAGSFTGASFAGAGPAAVAAAPPSPATAPPPMSPLKAPSVGVGTSLQGAMVPAPGVSTLVPVPPPPKAYGVDLTAPGAPRSRDAARPGAPVHASPFLGPAASPLSSGFSGLLGTGPAAPHAPPPAGAAPGGGAEGGRDSPGWLMQPAGSSARSSALMREALGMGQSSERSRGLRAALELGDSAVGRRALVRRAGAEWREAQVLGSLPREGLLTVDLGGLDGSLHLSLFDDDQAWQVQLME